MTSPSFLLILVYNYWSALNSIFSQVSSLETWHEHTCGVVLVFPYGSDALIKTRVSILRTDCPLTSTVCLNSVGIMYDHYFSLII